MQKLFVKNRNGRKLSVLLEGEEKLGRLAFVMHGLGGNKDGPHLQTFAQAFLLNGFTVVRFDVANTYGESDGNPEDETITRDLADLEDIINWAKKEKWYREPFWLSGHSLGGICTTLYAEAHPTEVAGLAPISTVVSWKYSSQTPKYAKDILNEWKKAGIRSALSETTQGLVKRLKWDHVVDRMQYDVLPKIKTLAMPVLLIVGDRDENTPPEHQKILFDVLPGPKEMYIIKGAPHTFREPEHLAEVKALFDKWIQKYV